ncbi:alcohol dehydrogenase [Neohortaea acidophila]|uniref:Alcohol dehydrogenase n=1 Tax=Neohortaea acidophila TaxID=245834 RepID=A0A6A6PHX7_9PEZI|nr:alcohol dehydrogenase [Neohortaea acidophila]KAF2479314.1 alcohol dehydrogenase [Neohortaea acidophila]
MADINTPSRRRAWRRTDDHTPGVAKLQLVTEDLPPLTPTSVLIKVHAAALNYRDANIANGRIIGNDAAGEVIALGQHVTRVKAGDRVAPITDTQFLNDRSPGRSWLAANEDGVLADYIVYDQEVLGRLPDYLPWENACLLPNAGCTAWSALKGVGIGKSVLIQGTGGVSSWALKLSRAAGLKVILTSSSDDKLERMKKRFGHPEIQTINYAKFPNWDEEVLKMTDGVGVDLTIDNGGASSVVRSMKSTRRGGIVSQVGYLGNHKEPPQLQELIPTIIDRRIVYRGINAGSVFDLDDLSAALESTRMSLDDIIDTVYPFEQAEEAMQSLWEGKVVGKLVLSSIHR